MSFHSCEHTVPAMYPRLTFVTDGDAHPLDVCDLSQDAVMFA